ncbi:MAG: hypothetical protein JSW28_08680, partial [Thermoplasmata archaeon]
MNEKKRNELLYGFERKVQTLLFVFVLICTAITTMFGTATADLGGPDIFGYIWIDSNAPTPTLPYNWIEINGTGVDSGISGDDNYGSAVLPFDFPYYGDTYNTINISTNGYLDFGNDHTDYTNDDIPNSGDPNNIIAPFWDDLWDGGGTIYYETLGVAPNRQFVVEYEDWYRLAGPGPMKFEVVLNETGEIFFQYFDLGSADSGQATVGIENHDGSDGLSYAYYDAAAVQPGLAVLLLYTPPPYRVGLAPDFQTNFGYPALNTDHTMTVRNMGTNDDTYGLTSMSIWPVTFRDIGDTMDITSIFVPSGGDADFIARVGIPGAASPGDLDMADITATSQGDPMSSDSAQTFTQVPWFTDWLDGFEGGWTGWTMDVISSSSPTDTYWQTGDPSGSGPGTAYNGANCSGTNIADVYYPGADITFVSPYVELGPSPMLLSFYNWYNVDTDGDDGGIVEISVAGGPWNQIWPVSGYPWAGGFMGGYFTDGYSGSSTGWEYEEYDLSPYANSVIQVRFHFAASDWWGWQWGWYVDEVYIGPPPPYEFDLTPDTLMDYGSPGGSVDHILTVQNTGTSNDTYDLSASGNVWPVTFRDIGDTMDITSLFVDSGSFGDFIVRVNIPGGANPGDLDSADITVTSQNDSGVWDTSTVRTQVPHAPGWFEGFESGWGAWSTEVLSPSNPTPTNWEFGDPLGSGPGSAYNGTTCSATNIADVYYPSADIMLISPFVQLGAAPQELTFYNWFNVDTGGDDGGFVEISVDGGPWNQIW